MVNNATGPAELVQALGKERVILGFPGAGGARTGPVVQCTVVSGRTQPTTIGELDGSSTARIRRIAQALETAGFPVAISRNMDAWLKTHVALISPIADSFYVTGDNYRLAADPQALKQMLTAIREGVHALEALGVEITPGRIKLLTKLPDWLLVPLLRKSFSTKRAELVMMRHAAIARSEMKQLADELMALVRHAGVEAPALTQLYKSAF